MQAITGVPDTGRPDRAVHGRRGREVRHARSAHGVQGAVYGEGGVDEQCGQPEQQRPDERIEQPIRPAGIRDIPVDVVIAHIKPKRMYTAKEVRARTGTSTPFGCPVVPDV
jgi:hypothetical protein